jgi:hypothetical protein
MTLTDFNSIPDFSISEWDGREVSSTKIWGIIRQNLKYFERTYQEVRRLEKSGEEICVLDVFGEKARHLFENKHPAFETGLTASIYLMDYFENRDFYLEKVA